MAPYTTDADLALHPELLVPSPLLESAMREAGFSPVDTLVGTWVGERPGDLVDLLVPAALGGPGRRSARLGPHGDRVARKGRGLEATLVDKMRMVIAALEDGDARQIEAWAAGPAALLVAKLHKLEDRRDSPSRLDDKDALDVYRLLQAVSTETLATGLRQLLADPISAEVTEQAIQSLQAFFGAANGTGTQMAARALVPLEDPVTVAASCAALVEELLGAM